MTAKEKSEELILKFMRLQEPNYNWFHSKLAKQCAIIAVNEIIKAIDFDWMEVQNLESEHRYWDKVKSEIEKL
jgi:nitrogenase molybdenum-iron protein alpha/beta subunit